MDEHLALLGPTNTGKSYTMLQHAIASPSAALGYPLRLLAQENYAALVRNLGESKVALLTGEERRVPGSYTHLVCTTDALRLERDFAMIGLDEIQFAAHRQRGHRFTHHLLHSRGTQKTIWAGSETMLEWVKDFDPSIQVEYARRRSSLSYVGRKKISRLPPRSIIVTFSRAQAYELAATLREVFGGVALVLGSLSPQTRNQQVALFDRGDVDYLVATDAVGHGLNLKAKSLYFASLSKFDGVMRRRLRPSEMAQIAGRAGRDHIDGNFGVTAGAEDFEENELDAILNHRFQSQHKVYYRARVRDFSSLQAMQNELEGFHPPSTLRHILKVHEEHEDLDVMKVVAADLKLGSFALRGNESVLKRLWYCARIPDFDGRGARLHGQRIAENLKDYILEGQKIETQTIEKNIQPFTKAHQDADGIARQLENFRFWSTLCFGPAVCATAQVMQVLRTVEATLSDALHERLLEDNVKRLKGLSAQRFDTGQLRLIEGQVVFGGEKFGLRRGFVWRQPKGVTQSIVNQKHINRHVRNFFQTQGASTVEELLADFERAPLKELHFKHDILYWRREPVAQISTQGVSKHGLVFDCLLCGDDPRGESITLWSPPIRGDVSAACRSHVRRWLSQNSKVLNVPVEKVEGLECSSDLRALLYRLQRGHGFAAKRDLRENLSGLSAEGKAILRSWGVRVGYHALYATHFKLSARKVLVAWTGSDKRDELWAQVSDAEGRAFECSAWREKDLLPFGYLRFGRYAYEISRLEKLCTEVFDPTITINVEWKEKACKTLGANEDQLRELLPKRRRSCD